MFPSMLPLTLLVALPCVQVWAHPSWSLAPRSQSNPLDSISHVANHSDHSIGSSWIPGWTAVEAAAFNWTKFNVVKYAFAETTPDVTVLDLTASNTTKLSQVVELARENDVDVFISVGGWTGSRYFSTAVATAENRTAFVKTAIGLVTQYKVDGLDFDWEYPNKQGVGCNSISPDDSANFLSFLEELRQDPVGKTIQLSAAVSIKPFMDSTGTPMKDVSAFAKVFNHISIMNYDIWGSWSSSVGPNAPLNDTCASPANQQGSAVSAVKAWTDAGFPVGQIVLGVAGYGHSFNVTNAAALSSSKQLNLYPAFNASEQPSGDSQDGKAGLDECGNPVAVGGIFNFWGLMEGGFLNTDGTVASGIDYTFDNCSQTAYVYNPTSDVMVSFDDAAAFTAKGKFISDTGLAGFSMWTLLSDYDNILVDAVSKGMGLDTSGCSSY